MKNNNKTYGCELIQKMKQDIDKLKKDTFTIPCLVKIVLSLAGIIIFAFVVRTFIPSRSPETVNYNIIVNKANENCKSEIKTEMAEALVKVEERAVNAYNDNFATLLTILTIFGIAWPLVIAYLQYRINKSDLRKIRKALKQSKKIKIMLDEFKQQAYCEIADAAHLNAIFWEEDMVNGKDEKTRDNGLRCHVRALIKSIYYYALAGKTGRANSKVKTAITRLREMNDWPPEKQSFVINEIDWGLLTVRRITVKMYMCKFA